MKKFAVKMQKCKSLLKSKTVLNNIRKIQENLVNLRKKNYSQERSKHRRAKNIKKPTASMAAVHRRRQGGEHRERSPRNWKNCCRKMMLFPKGLILATTFPQIEKFHFSNEFLSKNFKIFSKFPNNLYFSSKLVHWVFKILSRIG